MQLDRPKRRQRPREQAHQREPPNPSIPQDPFAALAPHEPGFQPPQIQTDPFRTRNPPQGQPQQGDPFRQTPLPFVNTSFGRPQNFQQDDPFSQKPFTPPKSFPNAGFSKPSTPPFARFAADKPSDFSRQVASGSEAGVRFASDITFGPAQQGDPFAQRPVRKPVFGQPFERRDKRESGTPIDNSVENDAFGVIPDIGVQERLGKRMPTPRKARSMREHDLQPPRSDGDGDGYGDGDLGDDAAVEPTKRRGQSRNQLLLTSVPIPLFSRTAIQRHFSNVQNITVSHVSLRGSRRPDARRTALISFPDERQATLALREGNMFRGTALRLTVYRQSAPEQVGETNELFFNYVPESLFSEEGVTDLFDSISDTGVVSVSLKEKPFYGSVKRTAIISFKSVAAASKALQNLPMYKGRSLTVSFRRTASGASNVKTALPEGGNEADMPPVKSYGTADRQGYDNGAEEMPSILKRIGRSPHQSRGAGRSVSQQQEDPQDYGNVDAETEDDYEQPLTSDVGYRHDEEEEAARSKAAKMKAEMNKLRAAIEKKQKERSLLSQGDRAKRESKLMVPKRREAPSTENDGSSGWRKVGEKVDIKNAMNFVGTCMTMCPLKEFHDRIIQRDISMFEKDDDGEPSLGMAVKKYRRSAAISEQPLPDEVRPPEVLLTTMNHLMKICDTVDAKFVDVHNFVRDRTRSLRQDFTLQGVGDESCIKIHEESVRFHILSEHRLFGTDPAQFSSKQNREQLDKCLISLREMYDLRRDNDLDTSPNEPEMQAYYMLTQMSDPKTCVQLCTGFSQDVRGSPPVQFALAVVRAASDSFGSFTRYFSLVRSAPYLMACLMHSRFSEVRVRALAIINSTHGNPPSRRDSIPISVLVRQLGFESEDEAVRFCETLGVTVENIVKPSNGLELPSIRTPSEGFDEANKTKWKASKADVLIESKARELQTSDIILGKGCNYYKSDDFMKKSSVPLKAKEKKPPVIQSAKPQSLLPESSQTVPSASANLPKLSPSKFAPEQTQPSMTRFPEDPKKSSHSAKPVFEPGEHRMRSSGMFTVPEPASAPGVLPTVQKEKRNLTSSPKELPTFPLTIPAGSPDVYPSSTFRPKGKQMSTGLPSAQKIEPPPKRTRADVRATMDRKTDSDMEKTKVALAKETADKKDDDLGLKGPSGITAKPRKPSAEKLKRAARLSALTSFITNHIKSNEADIEKVREIIGDVQTGKLRFPKAMEVWDDARDILLSVSEKSEQCLDVLEKDGSLEEDEPPEGVRSIADLRQKMLFFSQEGRELRDQLDEMFSKSLAVATANLKETGTYPTPESMPADVFAGITGAYLLDDDELPYDTLELPGSGSEAHNVVTTVLSTKLQKWQAIILPLTRQNEAGIAQKWLRQRFATNPDIEKGSLSLLDAKETGSVSLSVREIKQISAIPYTADIVILPCDISKTRDDLSSTWVALEQVLRKNRSITLSHNLPQPMVVILYYCGSSDMPSWLTSDDYSGSFASFQTKVQEKGYVATIEKLELPRVSAFQGTQCESFTNLMVRRIKSAAHDYAKLGAIPLKKNLRDYLVYVANNVLGEVLRSQLPYGDFNIFQQCIHDINQSWREIARHLRHEEARWPREMAVRRRLTDAFTRIESHLKLPGLESTPSTDEYIREMGAYVGLTIPTSRQLEGVHWFSSALSHLMDAFVCRKLKDCAVSLVYLSPEAGTVVRQRNAKRTPAYSVDPIRLKETEEGVRSRYISRTLLKQGTKRRRDNDTSNGYRRLSDPMKRRLSFSTADPIREEMETANTVPNRRRSLPASYGRRRLFEMFDSICREGQMFDDLLQTTMDALVAKRRRMENYGAVLAS